MRPRKSPAFRPCGEIVEQRLLTAALPPFRAALAERAQLRVRPQNPALRPPPRRPPGVTQPGGEGPTTPIGAGFLGNQGPRIGRPAPHSANSFFGVISITNKTEATITFSISASTYQSGKFFDFTLKPGASQLYFATYGGPFNSAPSFQVSLDANDRRDVIQLADVKTVYAPSQWIPTDLAQGRPYGITADAGFLNVVPIS